MSPPSKSEKARIFEMKFTLVGSGSMTPPWRKIQVPSGSNFHFLHQIIQVVLGWTCEADYRFSVRGATVVEPDPIYGLDRYRRQGLRLRSSRRTKLDDLMGGRRTKKAVYEYNCRSADPRMGSDWTFAILIEDTFLEEPGQQYPKCTDSFRYHLLEHPGGVWGYANLLELQATLKSEDAEERIRAHIERYRPHWYYHDDGCQDMTAWLHNEFGHVEFDKERVNKELQIFTPLRAKYFQWWDEYCEKCGRRTNRGF